MKIDIRTKNIEINPTLREHITRRLGFALGAREDQVECVQVMLTDINGPKGGEDKSCKIIIRLAGMKDIVIEDCQSKLRTAVDRAAARASQTLARKLTKWHSKRLNSQSRFKHQWA